MNALNNRLHVAVFLGACKYQGIVLDEPIMSAITSGKSTACPSTTFEPTPLLAAVVEAGRELRAKPGRHLANRPLVVTRPLRHNFGATVLANLISDSIDPPLQDQASFSITHANSPVPGIAACGEAEESFKHTFQALRARRDNLSGIKTYGSQIVTNDAGKALFVRKGNGEPSSLALQPFYADGIRYPAGSIVRLRLQEDDMSFNYRQLPYVPQNQVTVVADSQIAEIGFKRLSTFVTRPQATNPFTQWIAPKSRLAQFSQIADQSVRSIQYAQQL